MWLKEITRLGLDYLLFGSKTVGATSFYLGISSFDESRILLTRFAQDSARTLLGASLDQIIILTILLFLVIGATHVLGFLFSRRTTDKLKQETLVDIS